MRTADNPQVAIKSANHFAHYAPRHASVVVGLTLLLANIAIAHADPVTTDAYADRLTLRPLALPRGVFEARLRGIWTSSARFMTDPIATQLAGRAGFGPVEAHAAFTLHTRYSGDTMRPVRTESVEAGADYVISPVFVTGLEARVYHPLGGDIEQGYDLRGDAGYKLIFSPVVALIGYGGLVFQSRETRGQPAAADELAALTDLGLQLTPIDRLTIEGTLRARFNLRGNLSGDNVLGDIGASATVAIMRELDAFIETTFVILPWSGDQSDERIIAIGATYRHP